MKTEVDRRVRRTRPMTTARKVQRAIDSLDLLAASEDLSVAERVRIEAARVLVATVGSNVGTVTVYLGRSA